MLNGLREGLRLALVPLLVLAGLAAAALAGIALALALQVARLAALLSFLAGLVTLLLALLILLTLGHANPFRPCRRMPAAAVSPLQTRLNEDPAATGRRALQVC